MTSSSNEKLDSDQIYDDLIAILAQANGPHGDKTKGNLRKTVFLGVSSTYSDKGYVDPWGERFVIGVDSNYNKQVEGFHGETLTGKVFVYSKGPDGPDGDSTKDDDVLSWK